MLSLTYKNSPDSNWPLQARADGRILIFSGKLDVDRIREEKLAAVLEVTVKIVLWLLLALGCVALTVSAYNGWLNKNPLFFVNANPFNLTFYVTCLTTAYLWAKTRQEGLKEERLSLLKWGQELRSGKEAELDVLEFFNKEARRAWNRSLDVANDRKKQISAYTNILNSKTAPAASATDLFLSLLEEPDVKQAFWRLGVDLRDAKQVVKNYAVLSPNTPADELDKIPFIAFCESLKLRNKAIDPLMLLCALALSLPPEHIISSIFFNIDLTAEKLEILSQWVFDLRLLVDEIRSFRKLSRYKPEKEINRGLTSVPTYYLDKYSTDLTALAKHGALPLAWGRREDLRGLFDLLSEGRKNLLIKGQEGAGKTQLVNELAYKMVAEQVPAILEDKRLVKLEISSILGNPQKAESVFVHALQEAEHAGNIILVLEEIHELARVQASSGLNFLELLIDYLQDSSLLVLGTATLEGYGDYLQSAAGFQEIFASYELLPLSRENILLACCIRASVLEARGHCFFRYGAIEKAVELTDLYVKNISQPQKAIAVLVEASSRAKNASSKVIDENLIAKIVSEKTHIPTQTLSQDETEKLLNLEEELSRYIVGQEDAVQAVAEGLRRARSGLSSQSRPMASFLFLGPTGVGKTEIARALTKIYFQEEKYLLRLDMSEYRGPAGLDKLLGTEEGRLDSPLVRHIKTYPFCLLLLDEFEKASPEVLNIFLQILEDGRLTSGKGETLDLTHCLIIATSNAGTLQIQEGLKAHKTADQIKAGLFNGVLTQTYPPELLNRFDAIVIFNPLTPEEVEQVTWLQLEGLRQQLLGKGIKIRFTDDVVKHIATNAFDVSLGARPIRRYIQDHVESFIAKLILSKLTKRGTELTVGLEDGKLVLK